MLAKRAVASTEDYACCYAEPNRWFRMGKYLVPFGMKHESWRPTPVPREQVSVSRLASDYPEIVTLSTYGSAEVLEDYYFERYDFGKSEPCVLPRKFVPPAFVAVVRNGMSVGRHCCVVGPEGKAIRETGYHLDGAVIEDDAPISRLRLRYWRKRWEGDVTSRPWLPPKQHINGSVAVLNTQHSHNYYHWLCDILPRLVPLAWAGIHADYYLVDCRTSFQQSVLAAFGIESNRLIQPHCRQLLEADRLIVPSLPTATCLRQFGKMVAGETNSQGRRAAGRRIYISRKRTGKRTVANEAEFNTILEAHDFEAHSLEEYPLTQQARLIREAEIIIAPHGAGLGNLVFARPGTQVIEIVQEGRYNALLYPEKSRVLGLRHQQISAKIVGRKQMLMISPSDVSAALARAEQPRSRLAA